MTSLLRNRVEEQTRNPETSDTLLKDFRSTLEARWRAFDSSVPQTAKIFQHEPYVLAKKQYEKSMSLLQNLSTDAQLRSNPQIQHEIDTTIGVIDQHFRKISENEKNVSYNKALAEIRTSLAEFKKELQGDSSGVRVATGPQVIPSPTTPAAPSTLDSTPAGIPVAKPDVNMEGMQGVLSDAVSGAKEELPAIMSDVASDLKTAAAEALGSMGTTITEESTRFKKNPIQATLGLFGVSATSIAAGYKAAMYAREHGEGLDKFLAIFQTIWYKFLAKLTRTSLTSEGDENASVDTKYENEGGTRGMRESGEYVSTTVQNLTAKYLVDRVSERDYESFFGALSAAFRDGTVRSGEYKEKKETISRAQQMLMWKDIRSASMKQLFELESVKKPDEVAKKLGIKFHADTKERDQVALKLALQIIAKNKEFLKKHMKGMQKDDNTSFGDILEHLGKHIGVETLDAITTAIQDIDIKKGVSELSAKLGGVFFQKNADGSYSGVLAEKMKKIEAEGIDNAVMMNIFLPGASDAETKVDQYRNTLKNNPYQNPKTQEKMNELVDTENGFGKHVAAMMREMGFGDVASKLNNGDVLEMKELLTLYILSGGKTTLGAMTPGERNLVILYLITVIGRVSSGAVIKKSMTSFLSSADNKYMHEVVEIVGKGISDVTYMSVMTTIGVAKETSDAFWSLKDSHPKIFYGTIGIIFLTSAVTIRFRNAWITTATATGLITGALTVASTQLMSG